MHHISIHADGILGKIYYIYFLYIDNKYTHICINLYLYLYLYIFIFIVIILYYLLYLYKSMNNGNGFLEFFYVPNNISILITIMQSKE